MVSRVTPCKYNDALYRRWALKEGPDGSLYFLNQIGEIWRYVYGSERNFSDATSPNMKAKNKKLHRQSGLIMENFRSPMQLEMEVVYIMVKCHQQMAEATTRFLP